MMSDHQFGDLVVCENEASANHEDRSRESTQEWQGRDVKFYDFFEFFGVIVCSRRVSGIA